MDQRILNALKTNLREWCVNNFGLRQINDIFVKAGFSEVDKEGLSRRELVQKYYDSVNWAQADTQKQFFRVIEHILQLHFVPQDQKEYLRQLCREHDLEVESDGWQVIYSDLFKRQFPVGLPFGVLKPDFAITAAEGDQSLRFELKSGTEIIRQDVYPNFDFQSFQTARGITSSTNRTLKKSLTNMNQTDYEKKFFLAYVRHFGMAENHVPMLIPQAWIQWHSLSKKNLRAAKRPLADEMYRVDFVAFWANKRYAILIDDISHYAVKKGTMWIADEETYSKRLREDRKLQSEGWKIFRVSNWEIKQNRDKEILEILRGFIGF